LEKDGFILVHVVEQKDSRLESAKKSIDLSAIKSTTRRCCGTFESIEHTHLVTFRLQATKKPRARI
jgi:hypothetical protein